MDKRAFSFSDVTIACGLISLIVFAHVALTGRSASAAPTSPLLMQGEGVSYEMQVNENATNLEYNARNTLSMLGSAQMSYAASTSSGRYGELSELLSAGLLQPNQTGGTMVSGYSISFYLPPGRHGFTMTADAVDLTLRSFLLTENQKVVLLTPSVESDPNESWKTVRLMESELYGSEGRYDFLHGIPLINYDPPLQVRMNSERTNYVINAFIVGEDGMYTVDDSLIYSSAFMSYMIGDTRVIEEFVE